MGNASLEDLKLESRKVGAARYFLRMQISHIFEAFEIVQNEIELSAEPKAAIEACDAQTARGGGSMAQLNLPELGGTGQWMRGWSATCSTIP